jgi:hypothetical protein
MLELLDIGGVFLVSDLGGVRRNMILAFTGGFYLNYVARTCKNHVSKEIQKNQFCKKCHIASVLT